MAVGIARAGTISGYKIAPEVFTRSPGVKVAIAIARILVEKNPKDKAARDFISDRKQSSLNTFIERYPTGSEYSDSKVFESWRKLFGTFEVAPDKQCTLEPLFRRVRREAEKIISARDKGEKVPKGDLGKISNIVDLANCISIEHEVPIGVMDCEALKGCLELRNGIDGETFTALGDDTEYSITPKHLVLADETKVISWLWTCRVGADVIVREREDKIPTTVLICVDQSEEDAGDAEAAVRSLLEDLPKINGKGRFIGVVSRESPEIEINPGILDD